MPSDPCRAAILTVSYLTPLAGLPGRYDWISENLEKTLGYSARETRIPDWWHQGIHPEDRAAFERSLTRLAASGHCTCQYRFRDRSGRYVWLQDEMNLLLDADQRQGRVAGAWTVLSNVQGVEDELETARQRYLSLVNAVDGVVWEADAQTFDFRFVSEHAERLLGYPLDEWFRPGFWAAHIHAEDRDNAVEHCKSCTLAGQPHHLEYRFYARDGRIVWLHDRVSVICLDGQPRLLRGLMLDITQRRQNESERTELLRREQRARAEAEAANTRKDHFLAVLSHELRTPLTPVLARLSLLRRETGLSPRVHSALDMIRRNVELETRIIDDLLDLTKIVQGTLQLTYQRVDVHQAIHDALAIYQSEIESRELKVSTDLAAAAHEVWGDATRLEQVFWNLISNAVKYTPKSGRIGIRTRNDQRSDEATQRRSDGRTENSPSPSSLRRSVAPSLLVEISDSGVGIEAEVMSRLFNAFEQGEQTLSRRFGGLGLGLSISKTIIDIHGGSLRAFSEGKNKGATFTVELNAMAPAAEAAAPPAPAAVPKRAVKILLVEDNEDTQRVLARFLKLAGHHVRTAASMRSALDAAAEDNFDLILCDIGLPDGTGWELMQTLRGRKPIKGIALTGFASSEDAQKSKEAGFAEHLAKPIIPEKLEAVIQQVAS